MKKITTLFVLTSFLICTSLLGSTGRTLLTIKSSKNPISDEDRKVSNFKGVSSSGSYDVKINMGNSESLRLEGDQELIDEIETVVENGILKIRNKNKSGWNWRSVKGKVTVYIAAKTLNSITLSGSGNVSVNGVVKADKLSNTLSGSGSIMLSANAEEYTGSISGSGKIIVKGTANRAYVRLGGSGDFEGANLKASVAQIAISGSGNASINAEKSLDAKVSGSGNIRYSGNAKVSETKSGSGNIRRI